mmetsp:Transcript_64957/g.174193  ORF Transcript_64957/g.174193 Transcript_64957/m.174193 type:complete len:120 (+) Transcript_64957:96-455(+)
MVFLFCGRQQLVARGALPCVLALSGFHCASAAALEGGNQCEVTVTALCERRHSAAAALARVVLLVRWRAGVAYRFCRGGAVSCFISRQRDPGGRAVWFCGVVNTGVGKSRRTCSANSVQ